MTIAEKGKRDPSSLRCWQRGVPRRETPPHLVRIPTIQSLRSRLGGIFAVVIADGQWVSLLKISNTQIFAGGAKSRKQNLPSASTHYSRHSVPLAFTFCEIMDSIRYRGQFKERGLRILPIREKGLTLQRKRKYRDKT
ncbi:MAG: hypothetical protein IJT30_03185 [Muribaculaceae bacterium]|nr:hypothetical protein [Muribaculaceae bacterium]